MFNQSYFLVTRVSDLTPPHVKVNMNLSLTSKGISLDMRHYRIIF